MKRIVATTLALVFCACSWASAATSVWKVQKGDVVIYLGGTCHILKETDYPLPPEFEQAYRAADSIVLETDISRLNQPATQQRLLAKSVYRDGSTIDQHLSPRVYAALHDYTLASNVPLEQLRRLKPALLMVTLLLTELRKLGFNEQGVDQYFYQRARQDGKAIEQLETVDEQIDYLVSLADGDEDAFVRYSLKDLQTIREQFAIIVAAWRRGDADRLDELLVSELKTKQPQLYRRLIVERNRNWIPRIDQPPQPRRTRFILVGAAHLVGPDGIIAVLKQKGYRVEKL